MKRTNKQHTSWLLSRGSSLIELLLAIALFALILPALMTGFIASSEGKAQQEQRYQATLMVSEAEEAVRSVRERGWSGFAVNGVFHPQELNGQWTLQSGAETVGGYQRQIIISNVYRDNDGDIVTSGGTIDPSTKQVDISVTWDLPLVSLASSTMYLTRYLENLAFTHTTVADFSLTGYVHDKTSTVNNAGGEIVLSTAGPGRSDWCQPSLVSSLDLPGQGSALGLTAIPFNSYIGTGGNASGLPLTYVTINDNLPPVPTNSGEFTGSHKANDVFGDGTHAYLATDTNSSELVIVSTATMTEVGTFDASGSSDGKSIYVDGTTGFLVAGSTFYTINLSSKTGARPQYDAVNLAGEASSIYVKNGYAYVAINSTSNQLQIVNVSNPSDITIASSFSVNGQLGRDVHVSISGDRAYLATSTSASQSEFFIINVSNKTSPSLVSSFDTNGMDPRAAVTVLNDLRALVVGTGGTEYQVLSISTETNPTLCGSLNDDTGLYGVAAVLEPDSDAYAYVSTGQSSGEFKIIEGGPGDTVAKNGTFESGVVDMGAEAAVNGFIVGSQLLGSELRYQIAVADPISGSCTGANYVFVGPDGTSSTYFTDQEGSFPFNDDSSGFENPGQCLKYKVYFTSVDEETSPIFEDMTINYSP